MIASLSTLEPTADAPAVGDVVAGRYRLERCIGEGGQGSVWQARHLALETRVAVKFLKCSNDDDSRVERLLLEARTAAQLQHPAIVRVFDLEQTERGQPFLTMELLEGECLADLLAATHQLSPERALCLLLPIAEAVQLAHARGIVHRDIKPENIFIANGPGRLQPKLLDFGTVKVDAGRSARLTAQGAVLGSPLYLAPELARGDARVDWRVDIWAFSATLYECISGRPPFWADSYHALLRNIIEREPPSLVELGVGDAELWSIIRRGLAKDRKQRWPSMQALGQALANWLMRRGVVDDACGTPLAGRWLTPEPAPSKPHGGRRVAIGVAALAGALVAWLSVDVVANEAERARQSPAALLTAAAAFAPPAAVALAPAVPAPLPAPLPPRGAEKPADVVHTPATPRSRVAPKPIALTQRAPAPVGDAQLLADGMLRDRAESDLLSPY